jgi:hypothetical protein
MLIPIPLRTLIAGGSAFVVLGLLHEPVSAELKVEEQIVGPAYEQGVTYVLSPKGLHLATVHPKGSRLAVAVNGVQGLPFDEILKVALGELDRAFERRAGEMASLEYVAFSPDGARYAYAARAGKEILVMADGKEIYRAPIPAAGGTTIPLSLDQLVRSLTFSPDGKRVLFFVPADDAAKEQVYDPREGMQLPRSLAVRLMIDGKPASLLLTPTIMHLPRFNADGSHRVLVGGRPEAGGMDFLLVDGKDAGDVGSPEEFGVEMVKIGDQPRHVHFGLPQFTPDGKRLVVLRHNQQAQTHELLVDGKPILTSKKIYLYVVSSLGDVAAIALDRDGKRRLFMNGKVVAGTDHAYQVVFSPDGQRWAAACAELSDIAIGNSAGAKPASTPTAPGWSWTAKRNCSTPKCPTSRSRPTHRVASMWPKPQAPAVPASSSSRSTARKAPATGNCAPSPRSPRVATVYCMSVK